MNLKHIVPIKIETGLFELLSWQSYIPKKYPFMDATSLLKAGFNIDVKYSPVLPFHTLNVNETEEIYYKRCHYMTQTIVDRHNDDCNLFFCSKPLFNF